MKGFKEETLVKLLTIPPITMMVLGSLLMSSALAGSFSFSPSVPLDGTIVSIQSDNLCNTSPEVVFTTPTKGSFVLTEVCAGDALGQNADITVDYGSTPTTLARLIVTGGNENCVSFSPGFVMPQGTQISCVGNRPCLSSPSGPLSFPFCTIFGVSTH